MQIKDVDKLKAWLLGKLEPLCDADPAALAKYVVALLRKEKPKAALKDLCIDQLEVFLSKETTPFVEKLFRCLDSESYLKGEDPPKSPPTNSAHVPARMVERMNDHVHSSTRSDGDRRHSEDARHREVDDDDRDFRRSRRHETESFSGSGGRRIVAPIQVNNYGGRGGGTLAGKKRGLNSLPDPPTNVKRRMVVDHSRDPEPHHRSNVSSSSTSLGGLRRSVRDRLGPRPDINRSDPVVRRKRRSSSTTSSSSSDSSSMSDSSSPSSGEWTKRRKTRKTASNATTMASSATPTSTSANTSTAGGGGASGADEEEAAAKKKQRCADYDKKGFCILGESCPFDHGLDPLVIGGSGLSPYGHPPPGMAGIAVPTLPPSSSQDSKSESYNPEEPGLSPSASGPTGFIPTHIGPPPALALRSMFPPPPPMPGMMPSQHPHLPPFPPHHFAPPPPNMLGPPGSIHRPPRHSFPPTLGTRGPMRPSDTLIVRKVPKELNSITKLSSHFEKFGTIVNLTVRYEGDLEGALVQFSSPAEAKKAHDSAEAVLNNRFIKVYYLRKDSNYGGPPTLKESTLEGPVSVAVSALAPTPSSSSGPGGSAGSLGGGGAIRRGVVATLPAPDQLQSNPTSNTVQLPTKEKDFTKVASKPVLTKLGDVTVSSAASNPVTTPKVLHPPASSSSSLSIATAVTSTAAVAPTPPVQQRKHSAEVTKKKLELHKKTQELMKKQIEQQKKLIEKLEKSGKSLSTEEKNVIMKSLKSLSASISKLKEAANKTVLTQRQEQQTQASKDQSLVQLEKNRLKEKAEALRKQAHKLGLISHPSQPLATSGKGRGKPVANAKPRQLLVIGAKEKDQIVSYFESFGSLDSVEVDPSNSNNLIFTFQHSSIANQVAKSGGTFKGKPLIMKWYQPKSAPPTTTTTSSLLSSHQSNPQQQQQLNTAKTLRPVATTTLSSSELSHDVSSLTTPTLAKPDPQDLHLFDDSEDEEDNGEERAWRR